MHRPLPPAPGPELSVDSRLRYARQLVLPGWGDGAQRRLRASRVLVVGAGGLGSPVLLYLAGAGVGTLGVVDSDQVEVTNLHRQLLHDGSAVGQWKVHSAAERIRRCNPEVRVRAYPERFTEANADRLTADYDLVVDGSDNFPTRYLIDDVCTRHGRPEVWGAVQGFDGQVSVFWAGHGPTYRDLHPDPPAPGTVPSGADSGVVGPACGLVGSVMAMETLKVLTGIGEPLLGRILVLDGAEMTWRTLQLRPAPDGHPTPRPTGTTAANPVPGP